MGQSSSTTCAETCCREGEDENVEIVDAQPAMADMEEARDTVEVPDPKSSIPTPVGVTHHVAGPGGRFPSRATPLGSDPASLTKFRRPRCGEVAATLATQGSPARVTLRVGPVGTPQAHTRSPLTTSPPILENSVSPRPMTPTALMTSWSLGPDKEDLGRLVANGVVNGAYKPVAPSTPNGMSNVVTNGYSGPMPNGVSNGVSGNLSNGSAPNVSANMLSPRSQSRQPRQAAAQERKERRRPRPLCDLAFASGEKQLMVRAAPGLSTA
eukprot:TRINITY_DN10544_c0_g1_i2.p1 TRINITY_DN10544_c0_g1~~TRINITY_DN10544_c0_g1_i2.p1  ORF type:complete len:268 (+),score=15.28 TRINITY_DN10544_c0_g1_i2:66-869(+)